MRLAWNLLLIGLSGPGVSATPPDHSLDHQVPLEMAGAHARLSVACPEYKHYSATPHSPLGDGPMKLPYQRPSPQCRTFSSPRVEQIIQEMTSQMEDKDLARIFENAFPNTLDTTVRWHVDGTDKSKKHKSLLGHKDDGKWEGAQSFIVTGDIDAEWLRDSTNQLEPYLPLAKHDKKIENLILGAINTQSEFVLQSPYCNAFQPPPPSGLPGTTNGQPDNVHPTYEPSVVFECKYELDSIAHFLALTNQFHNHTGSVAFLTPRWAGALQTVMRLLDKQSEPTFDPETARYQGNEYMFQRGTTTGTETLNLGGLGNPLNWGTGLVRSAFRPSDDATILGFYIPANAMMAVELQRLADVLRSAGFKKDLVDILRARGKNIEKAVWEHGVVHHKTYGDVFAYEVDGYGSHILMDDANVPSLLALPALGFVDASDKTYQNTRRMLLEKAGNPYYLIGPAFRGIGGPHIGLQNAWPMSLLLQALTSDNDTEIQDSISLVRDSSRLGLIHESINVLRISAYTRSWFAWSNSLFSVVMIDLAKRKPHLLFGKGAKPYIVE